MSADTCTVVVNSCDAYSDLWTPFFEILSRNWAMPYPVVLNTEHKDFEWRGLDLKILHTAADTSWTARLRGVLERIDTPYVLLLLDDFFMTGPVDQARIEQCIAAMDNDQTIACFSFYPTTGNADASAYSGFEKRPRTGLYRFNAQAGLWRRERLIAFLQADEDAWEWENEGNRRSFGLDDAFYSEADSGSRIFPYDYMTHGLIGGRWFPETKALFARYGILDFPFEQRGFYDEKDWALLPSTASAFVMDSVLYSDVGRGYCEQDSQICDDATVKTGNFSQRYALADDARTLRWDPSTHKGFAIRGLQVTDGRGNTLAPRRTNAVQVGDLLVFLQDDPQMEFKMSHGTTAVCMTGEAVCPLDLGTLRAAQNSAPRTRWLDRLRGK